jgi:hypothetical protein
MKLWMKFGRITILTLVLALLVAVGCQRADVAPSSAEDEGASTGGSSTAESAEKATISSKGAGAGSANEDPAEPEKVNEGSGKGEARSSEARAEGGSGAVKGTVRLKISGKPGTEFTGTCNVGGDEREVSGQVPGRFVYEPDGRKVECEIRNGGPEAAQLKFSVDARGVNQKQKIRVTGDNVDFTFSGNSISYNVSSASSSSSNSGSVVQKSRISSSSYSSSSVSSSSGSR